VSARDDVLSAVRAAIRGAQDGEVPREFDHALPEPADVVELFAERVADYKADVRRVSAGDLPRTIGAVLAEHGVRSVVVPSDVDPSWLSTVTCKVVRDEPSLSASELDGLDAVITGCAVGVALTGTIVLDAGQGQGRRAISLVPDLHLCVVRVDQIVGSVPEGVARLGPSAARPLTWISGPSATSDIELNRVEGVHGPRTLLVLIAG